MQTGPSSHQLVVIMDQDEQQQFQHEDAYSVSGAFGSWDPGMHLPTNQQRPGLSGYFESYYSYGPMRWPLRCRWTPT